MRSVWENRRGLIRIISFTTAGHVRNQKLAEKLEQEGWKSRGYRKGKSPGGHTLEEIEDMGRWLDEGWGTDAYLFIGAAGIAVRSIAPFVKDKFSDSPVIVMDEKGTFVIPLLSSHVGGAGEIAALIASMEGAIPVVTTATDLNEKFAVDVFAVRNGMTVTDKVMAKEISSWILRGKQAGFYSDFSLEGELPEELCFWDSLKVSKSEMPGIAVLEKEPLKRCRGILYLFPKILCVGIGCRRGVGKEKIEREIRRIIENGGWKMEQIAVVASIDLKADEKGILEFVRKYKIPFQTYTASELNEVEGVSSSSEFVKKVTGTDNVCERAALLAGKSGDLVHKKEVSGDLTIAIVRMDYKIVLTEGRKEE